MAMTEARGSRSGAAGQRLGQPQPPAQPATPQPATPQPDTPEAPPLQSPECQQQLLLPIGHTLILDGHSRRHCGPLQVGEGLLRVAYLSNWPETPLQRPLTIGFLQAGDPVPLQMLAHSNLHLEAIQPSRLCDRVAGADAEDTICLADWTASLLALHRLPDSDRRLQALLQLLVHRLGQRRGPWYHLPMRLKHESLAEMVNHSRVTVTRHMSRWRKRGWIDPGGPGRPELRLAPALIEG
jgi:hypothetical protein